VAAETGNIFILWIYDSRGENFDCKFGICERGEPEDSVSDDYDNDRPLITEWPPKTEMLISLELWPFCPASLSCLHYY